MEITLPRGKATMPESQRTVQLPARSWTRLTLRRTACRGGESVSEPACYRRAATFRVAELAAPGPERPVRRTDGIVHPVPGSCMAREAHGAVPESHLLDPSVYCAALPTYCEAFVSCGTALLSYRAASVIRCTALMTYCAAF